MSSRPGEDVGRAVSGHVVIDAVAPLQTVDQGQLASGVAMVPCVALGAVDRDSALFTAALGDDLRQSGSVGCVLGGDAHRLHVLIMSHRLGVDNRCLTL